MVSDFDFIGIHAAARKSKQRHGWFLGNLPYLPRPPAGPFPGRGCHRLRPALPHHSPAYAVASPELTNTEGTYRSSRLACHSQVNGLRRSLGRLGFTTSLKPSVIAPLHLPLGIQGKYLWHRIFSCQRTSEGCGSYDSISVGRAGTCVTGHTHQACPAEYVPLLFISFSGVFFGV